MINLKHIILLAALQLAPLSGAANRFQKPAC